VAAGEERRGGAKFSPLRTVKKKNVEGIGAEGKKRGSARQQLKGDAMSRGSSSFLSFTSVKGENA